MNTKNKDLIKIMYQNIKKDSKEFLDNFVYGAKEFSKLIYAAPTTYRLWKQSSNGETDFTKNSAGISGAVIGGSTSVLIPLEIAKYTISGDNSFLYGFIPLLATNVISGIYELGKHQYNKAKSQLEEKIKTQEVDENYKQ